MKVLVLILFSAPKPPTSVGGYHQIGFACKKYSC